MINVAPEVTVKRLTLPLHCDEFMDCLTEVVPSPISISPETSVASMENPEPKTLEECTFKKESVPPNLIFPENTPKPVESFREKYLLSVSVQVNNDVFVRLKP